MARLSTLRSLSTASLVAIVLAIAACSNDDNPSDGGPADTTAPSVSNVNPIDANHIEVTFSENLQRSSAEDRANYHIVETATPLPTASQFGSEPGDTLAIMAAALKSDLRTVSLTTDGMSNAPYDMNIIGVADASGNEIVEWVSSSFTGTNQADATPPEITYRSPGPNATGVSLVAPLTIVFSEAVDFDSFVNGVSWTSNAGEVSYVAESEDGGVHITVSADTLLTPGTLYTVTMTDVRDDSNNAMPPVTWSFTTTSTTDHTPPTIVSSYPTNGATYVPLNTVLSFTFSEPVNQQAVYNIQAYPDVGNGVVTWSNGGKTLSFAPLLLLATNQQYVLTVPPGGFEDLFGNKNVNPVLIRFTTGSALAAGSIAGTLSGDPQSDSAADPTGALVFAVVAPIESLENLRIAGSAMVPANNSFDLQHLPDAAYTPFAIMDTNGDHELNPVNGDAFGIFGIDYNLGDLEPDSVIIAGGNRILGANFRLLDPSVVAGTLSYEGAYASEDHFVGVGLFDVVGFDPNNPPAFTAGAYWLSGPEWQFFSADNGPSEGSFYLGAFLDADDNFNFDPATDPAGIYGGLATPITINVDGGRDTNGLVIVMEDPVVSNSTASIRWPVKESKTAKLMQRLAKALQDRGRATTAKHWNDKAGSR